MTRDDITKEHVDSVRNGALTKFAEYFANGTYDERDVRRFKTDDDYVTTFIRGPGRLQEAIDIVHECLKWRNEFKIREIKEETFELPVWERGAVYFHNVDKDGHPILYFRTKEHKKGENPTERVKQFVAYWLESAFNEKPHEKIVVLFDMTGTGLSNLDMDLIKFVITSFKFYYPTLLAYMLVYEMPWVLSAAWRIIKTWLSAEAQSLLKFVTRSDIQEYINRDQLMEHMGGMDKFKYEYIPPENREAGKKRVTFADQDPTLFRSFSENLNEESKANGNSPGQVCLKRKIMCETENDENTFIGRLLTIKPAEVLEFSAGDGSKEAFDIVFLTNTLPYPIAYKVKTTSPEKYRVRPSYGIVKPGTCSKVFIYLHCEYQDTVCKDRFLIMAMEVTDDNVDSALQLWKNAPKENIMEHRLRCVFNPCARSPGRLPVAPKQSMEQYLVKISDQLRALESVTLWVKFNSPWGQKMQSMIRSSTRQEYLIKWLLATVCVLYGILGMVIYVLVRHPEWLNVQTGCRSVLF